MTTTAPDVGPDESVALVGIGSELRGDDAVGLELVRRFDAETNADRVLIVEGGVAPENHTGVIRAFEPDWIVLVDAIDFGGEPGAGKWVDPDDLGGESFSSHKSTPAMLRTFLARETGADVALFGVQPADIDREKGLSPAVTDRLEEQVQRLLLVVLGADTERDT